MFIVQDEPGSALIANGFLIGMGHSSRACFSRPGIYTRLSNQANWIQSTIYNDQGNWILGTTNYNQANWIPGTIDNNQVNWNQNSNQGWTFPDPR